MTARSRSRSSVETPSWPASHPLTSGRLQVAPAAELELWLEAVKQCIRVRSVAADLQELRGCEVLSAVFRPRADLTEVASASLRARAKDTMRQGMEQVHAELDELRRAGLIDGNGRRLVDLPPDMRPGSRSDV